MSEALNQQVSVPYRLTKTRTALLVVLLLIVHYTLAFDSLRRENPTVDEVAHLPAGISYWQKGTFKLYHHNPPLTKLIAAIPVLLAGCETAAIYGSGAWTTDPPSHAGFGELFAFMNALRYFELFTLARMVMPIFSIVGGLFVFAWSSRLYGRLGGLLSLALWCFCPNVLAHARLVTSDVAGASMALGATYLFWRYLGDRRWKWTIAAGMALGLAQLTKFSLVLLYIYLPFIWLAQIFIERRFANWPKRLWIDLVHGSAMVAISVLVMAIGYNFEGLGKPLGSFEFASASLTRPITQAELSRGRPSSANPLLQTAWQHRINRFRGTWLDRLPAPLPSQFLLGFDDQRIETEGMPAFWFDSRAKPGEKTGYPVYLNGVIRRTGWWYYYLECLVYKVPEGTWLLGLLSIFVLAKGHRNRTDWFNEGTVLAYPMIVLFVMSVLTDINLGLRYVLPVLPFGFVAIGKVVPYVRSLRPRFQRIGGAGIIVALGLTTLQTALIHPSYLASFNWIAGGPDRGSEHLIDSNLDWGQDLISLKQWLAKNRPGQRVGLAYFGQINPTIFLMRGEEFKWFLPPSMPKTVDSMDRRLPPRPSGVPPLRPGIYAVSASLVRGLPFRLFESGDPYKTWSPSWNATDLNGPAFGYFAELTPTAKVGHSIFVYDLTQEQCDRINPRLLNLVPAQP